VVSGLDDIFELELFVEVFVMVFDDHDNPRNSPVPEMSQCGIDPVEISRILRSITGYKGY
jgi:hypothetical protein